MNKPMHNKLILHTVDMYLEKALENDCYQKDNIRLLRSKILGYKTFHKFTKAESDEIIALGTHQYMVRLRERHVDYAVYALSLLAEWVERRDKKDRPALNISDKRMLEMKSNLIMDMLMLKKREPEIYNKVKDIIAESKMVAKMYVTYTEEN